MAKRRLISNARKQRIGEHMALVVVALQAALILALALTPGEPPALRMELLELLWAAARRPTFYPFVALITAGPVLTLVAVRIAGRHRAWLAIAWCTFALVIMIGFADRIATMLRVLRWYYGE